MFSDKVIPGTVTSNSGRGADTLRPFLLVGGDRLSVQAISWVLEYSESRLGPRHVLISIANHAKSDGTGAWPSVSTISHEAKLSEREVRYALRDLEKSGELTTQKAKGPHGCNVYSLPLMRLQGGQSLQGQKTTNGGQNTTKTLSDFAPEPKSFNRPIKQPKPRAQNRSARNRFDDEIEQRRRIEARDNRIVKEEQVRLEINVGAGPELVRDLANLKAM